MAVLLLIMNVVIYYIVVFIQGSNKLIVSFIGIIVLRIMINCVNNTITCIPISQCTFNLYLFVVSIMELITFALNYYIATRLVEYIKFSNTDVKLLAVTVMTLSLNKMLSDLAG